MLPPACSWRVDEDGTARLYWNFACVAIVYADGRVRIQGWGHDMWRIYPGRSQTHSMRMVEKWVSHRKVWPGSKAAEKRKVMRERMLRKMAQPPERDPFLGLGAKTHRPLPEVQKIDYWPEDDWD